MKILITGGSGFIGGHLTKLLSQEGHEIIGLDLREPVVNYGLNRFHKADVRIKETLTPALEGVECVIHMAAVHFDYGHKPAEYWDANEGGTQRLMEAISEAGVDKILFCSTIAIYGQRFDKCNEDTEPAPTTPYGSSKLAAENIIRRWVLDDIARSAVILRPCAVYGERNITNMNNLIRQIDSGFFVKFGTGENIKATAYVGNLVKAVWHCLGQLEPGLKIFNYTDEPDITVNEIISVICDELGKRPPIVSFPVWLGVLAAAPFSILAKITGKNFPINIKRVKKLSLPTCVDAQAIRKSNFRQTFTSEEGLRRTVRHYIADVNKELSYLCEL